MKIKFRYYDVNPGMWVYRFENVSVTSDPNAPIQLRHPRDVVKSDAPGLVQYTGLKDKNGVEIYEGDLVTFKHEIYEHDWAEYVNQTVKYDTELACFMFGDFCMLDRIDHLIVTGNIYES